MYSEVHPMLSDCSTKRSHASTVCPSVQRNMERWWLILIGETECWRKTCPGAALCTTNLTCTGAGPNPGHYSIRTACTIDTQPCYCKNWLMLYREIVAVCSEIHTEHINTRTF